MNNIPTCLYAANIAVLEDPSLFASAMDQLPPWRQIKVRECKQPKDQQRALGAGLLLKIALSNWNIDLCTLDVQYGQHGKPHLIDTTAPERCLPSVNLSHSGDWVLCALSSQPVGCDAETYRKVKAEAIARRFFHPCEQQQLHSIQDTEEYLRLFFQIWTGKESYLKMIGEGLHAVQSAFQVDVSGYIIKIDTGTSEMVPAYLAYYSLSEDSIACICSPVKDFEPTPRIVELFPKTKGSIHL